MLTTPNPDVMDHCHHYHDAELSFFLDEYISRPVLEDTNNVLLKQLPTTYSDERTNSSQLTNIGSISFNLLYNDCTENISKNVDISEKFMMEKRNSNSNVDEISRCFNDISNGDVIMNADIYDEFLQQLVTTSDQNFEMVSTDCVVQNHEKQQVSESVLPCITDVNMNSTNATTMNNVYDQSVNRATIDKQHASSSLDLKKLNVTELAKRCKFNLIVPTEDKPEKKNFRLNRKSFAIVCNTSMEKESIMAHIQNEFNQRIKYVCISSHDNEETSDHRRTYIQIILKNTINKKTYFLKPISGLIQINYIRLHPDTNYFKNIYITIILGVQCNYLVTSNDFAWNLFVKKVGSFIEVGQYQSVKSRIDVPSTKNVQQKQKNKKEKSKRKDNAKSDKNKTDQLKANQITESIMTRVKSSIEEAINTANTEMPTECVYERERLLNKLQSLYDLAQNGFID